MPESVPKRLMTRNDKRQMTTEEIGGHLISASFLPPQNRGEG